MTKVSIIIPAYNAAATLEACLAAALAQSWPACEVLLVDDGSQDATRAIAQSFEQVRYIHQENQGPAAARNLGAQEATGTILAYTDADCIAHSTWIEALLAEFEEGVVATGGSYDIANPQFLLARIVHAEILARHLEFQQEVDFLGSFNVAYQKEAFESVGGFDLSFRMASGEDNDLAYRLLDAGGKLRFCKSALVAHHHPVRLWPYLKTQARHGYWRVLLYKKHPKRSGGDQYAGPLSLCAPPLAMLLLFSSPCVPLLMILSHRLWPLLLYAGLCALQSALHLPLVLKLGRVSGKMEMLSAMLLLPLRDMARGLGLLKGLLRFHIWPGDAS